jgi:hypothetical protein
MYREELSPNVKLNLKGAKVEGKGNKIKKVTPVSSLRMVRRMGSYDLRTLDGEEANQVGWE